MEARYIGDFCNNIYIEIIFAKIATAYKKHYPPSLGDDVWRLEKIGKNGAFDKRLADAGIRTVQDFLKQLVIDPGHLRTVRNILIET